MSVLLDELYEKALDVFDVDGLGNVIYANQSTWMGLANQWRGKAEAQMASFVSESDWETLSAADAKKADTDVYMLATDTAGVVLDWAKKNLLGQDVATMSGASLKTFLMASYAKAAQALALHESGEMQASIDAGEITESQARKNLDSALRSMELIAKGGQQQLYKPLQGVSGLGVAPAVVAIIVAGVAVVLLYAIYRVTDNQRTITTAVTESALTRCDKLLDSNPELYVQCIQGVQAHVPKTGDLMEPLVGASKIIAYGVAGGVLIWVGVKFVLPALLETGHLKRGPQLGAGA